MKGKILISGLSLALCVTTLAGCGNQSETAAVTNLANQLDKTNNSIASVKQISDTDLDVTQEMIDKIATGKNNDSLNRNISIAKNALLTEQFYKNNVLYETAKIKRFLSKEEVKLAKNQISAIKDLTASLSKYNNSVAYSGNEFNSTYRNYNNMKKNANKNTERVNAKLNKLACNSNARCSYYENLLNTLRQVEDVLGIPNYLPKNEENQPDINENNNNSEVENETQEIIDNVNDNLKQNENVEVDENKNKEDTKKSIKNIDTFENNTPKKVKNENANNQIPNNINYTNQPYNNGYYNAIGNRHTLNPNRNTDTYGPTRRNIDTFRNDYNYNNGIYNGNIINGGMYGNNGIIPNSNNMNRINYPLASTTEVKEDEKIQPEKRLEEFENKMEEMKIKNINQTEEKNIEIIDDNEERVVAQENVLNNQQETQSDNKTTNNN